MVYEIDEGKVVRKYNKSISYRKIEIIHLAMQLPYELGGSLDFSKSGKFLRIQLYVPGDKKTHEISLHDNLGVEFHLHQDPATMLLFPSGQDLLVQAKRSINSRSKVIKKYKNFRGPIAIVFNPIGAVTYAYKRCKIPTRKELKQMIDIIVAVGSETPRDTLKGLEKTARLIRPFGYRICVQSWKSIKANGLKLKYETRRFHRLATK